MICEVLRGKIDKYYTHAKMADSTSAISALRPFKTLIVLVVLDLPTPRTELVLRKFNSKITASTWSILSRAGDGMVSDCYIIVVQWSEHDCLETALSHQNSPCSRRELCQAHELCKTAHCCFGATETIGFSILFIMSSDGMKAWLQSHPLLTDDEAHDVTSLPGNRLFTITLNNPKL